MVARKTTKRKAPAEARRGPTRLGRLTDEQLLDMRFHELPVDLPSTRLARSVDTLYGELEERGIGLRPHCWLAEEWFSPDGIPGIAIPFYLAHPRLMELERSQMFEVEGEDEYERMAILRHEAGHAIDTAYRLHRRSRWRKLFGPIGGYPDQYRPQPESRAFVQHFSGWYAQSHPSEDFAETFAVWLSSDGDWRKIYAGWPALQKLRYVDELMEEIAGVAPPVRSRRRIDPISSLRTTLRSHYQARRSHIGREHLVVPETDLRRIFMPGERDRRRTTAAELLEQQRGAIRKSVSDRTGVSQVALDFTLRRMAFDCERLDLVLRNDARMTRSRIRVLLTRLTMRALRSGTHRVAL